MVLPNLQFLLNKHTYLYSCHFRAHLHVFTTAAPSPLSSLKGWISLNKQWASSCMQQAHTTNTVVCLFFLCCCCFSYSVNTDENKYIVFSSKKNHSCALMHIIMCVCVADYHLTLTSYKHPYRKLVCPVKVFVYSISTFSLQPVVPSLTLVIYRRACSSILWQNMLIKTPCITFRLFPPSLQWLMYIHEMHCVCVFVFSL